MQIDPQHHIVSEGLRARIRALVLTDFQLWLAYLTCGGSGDPFAFEAYLHGALAMARIDWIALTHMVCEAENL